MIKVVVGGRTLLALTGSDEHTLTQRLAAAPLQVIREDSPGAAAAREPWCHRAPVLAAVIGLLVVVATLWFFRGATWAATVPAVAGVPIASAQVLRAQLLAVNDLEVPFAVREEHPGGRIEVTWRFADAKWVDQARAHGMRATHRIVMELDEEAGFVRPTEQCSALD